MVDHFDTKIQVEELDSTAYDYVNNRVTGAELLDAICKRTGIKILQPEGLMYDYEKYRGRHPEFEKLEKAVETIIPWQETLEQFDGDVFKALNSKLGLGEENPDEENPH